MGRSISEPHRELLTLLVGEGMLLVAAGVVLGLFGARSLTRVIASLLFDVRATDPLVFGGAAALLAAVALIACYVPARRAAPGDPVAALRCD